MMMMEENGSIKSAVSSMGAGDSTLTLAASAASETHDVNPTVSVRIYVPELNVQKVIHFHREELVWNVKQQCLATLPKVSPSWLFSFLSFPMTISDIGISFFTQEKTKTKYVSSIVSFSSSSSCFPFPLQNRQSRSSPVDGPFHPSSCHFLDVLFVKSWRSHPSVYLIQLTGACFVSFYLFFFFKLKERKKRKKTLETCWFHNSSNEMLLRVLPAHLACVVAMGLCCFSSLISEDSTSMPRHRFLN